MPLRQLQHHPAGMTPAGDYRHVAGDGRGVSCRCCVEVALAKNAFLASAVFLSDQGLMAEPVVIGGRQL